MRKSRILAFILVLSILFTAFNISIAYAAPAAPTGLKATVPGSSSVKLTWNAVSGAAKYQVYKGTSASSMALAATVTTATWTPTALTSSTKYYFKVRALTSAGAVGAFSATVSATTAAGIAAPTGVKATSASSAQINLTWNAVSGATGYTVYRAASSTGAYSKIATVTAKAYNNMGLAANTVYYYKVRAVNAKGEGKYSAAVSARTRPAVPAGLKAAAPNTTSIKLTWNAVAGATKYLIYRCATATGTFTKIAEATTATFTNTGLAINTTYYYKVSAVSVAGEGGKTAAVSGRTRPPAPAGLKSAALNSSSIKLTWTAVSGATKYIVYRSASSTGAFAKVGEATTATFTNTGLAANTAYYYKVSAVNAGGEGAQSAAVSGKTPVAPPAAPAGLSAASQSTSVIKLTWSAATGATKYIVYRSASSTGTFAKVGEATTATFTNTGLVANTTYYYKVSAVGAGGEGAQSAVVSGKTPMAPPAAPAGLSAAALNSSSIKLTWTAVSGATKYVVYRSASSTGTFAKVGEATTATFTNTGLAANTTYYYKVSAVNAGGEGAQSAAVSGKTPVAPPAAPAGLSAAALNSSSIKLTWTAVSGATKYAVYSSASSTGTFTKLGEATMATFTNTGLAANTTYYYKVSAINAGGEGGQSAAVSGKTPVAPPAAPAGLAAMAQSTSSIKLTWTAVGGATGYRVYRSTASGGPFAKVADATAATFTDTGLAANTTYYYKVSAVNAGGEGAQSTAVSGKTLVAPPAAPTGLAAAAQSTSSIKLTWTAVGGATGYRVYRATASGGPFAKVADAAAATFTDTGLAANTTYYYKVSAVNAAGESAQSTAVSAATLAAPTNLRTSTYNFQSVWLNFDQVENAVTYRIYYSKTASSDIAAYEHFDYASNDFRAIGLDAATTYYFRVAAVASGGAVGTPTGFIAGMTAAAPGTPPQPKFYLYNFDEVTIKENGQDVLKYRMNFCRSTSPIYPPINDPTFNFYVGSASTSMTFDSTCDLSGYFYLDVNPGQALYYGFTANYGAYDGPYASSRQLIQVAALGKPQNVTANGLYQGGKVNMSWTPVTGAAQYRFYYCVGGQYPGQSWFDFKASAGSNLHYLGTLNGGSSSSAVLTGVPDGLQYFFFVVPANASGVEGWDCGYAITGVVS